MNTNKHCEDILRRFPDAEAAILDTRSRQRFDTHLRECAECAAAWDAFLTAVEEAETALADARTAPEGAPPDYWETFLPRLRSRIGRSRTDHEPGDDASSARRTIVPERTMPVWALPAAAALVLGFCLGALLGTGWGAAPEPATPVSGSRGANALAMAPAESASNGTDSNSLPADDYAPVTLPQNSWDYDWDSVDSLEEEQVDLLVAELLGEIS